MLHTVCRAFFLSIVPYLLQAQFVINSPQTRSVVQRDGANRAQLRIAGTAPNSAATIEARLIPMILGQGTPLDWTLIATVTKNRTFNGTLAALGGWYRVEIRAKAAATVVADTAVNRVGVGEVFVIAGQSNAQGIPQAVVPAATDDRVSCIDLFQRDQIDPQVFPLLFSHLSAGTNIGPSNSPHLWGVLGDSLAKRLNVPILFLGAAQGGSNSTEWKYSTAATPNVLPYQRVSATLSFYVSRLGMRAVLWHQGESDSGVSEQTYFDNLSSIISKTRQQLTYSRLAWLVSRASYISGTTNSDVIRAQNRLSAEVSEVYAGPATDGLTGTDNRSDNIHFSGQGLVRAANLWNQSLTDRFFSVSRPFIPATDTTQTDGGWQPLASGNLFSSLQRVGYRYEPTSHLFTLLVGATAPVEGRLERLDRNDFADTTWIRLTSIAATGTTDPSWNDFGYIRFYQPTSPGLADVPSGQYRLSVRPVGNTGPGYRLETVLHDFRNTLFIGNDLAPAPPLIQQADLSLGLQIDRRVVSVGQVVTQQLLITNKGPQSATGVRIQSQLPAGLSFTDSLASSVTVLNGLLTARVDSLPPYKSRKVLVRTVVNAPGSYVLAAQITASNQFDPNSQPGTGTTDGQDDRATVDLRTLDNDSTRHTSVDTDSRVLPAVIINQPSAELTKADLSLALQTSSLVVAPGASLTVVCAVTNGGGLAATSIQVQFLLPTNWQLVSATDLISSGQTLTGKLAKLPAGATALMTLVVRAGATTGRPELSAQIASVDQADPDSTPGNGYHRGEDDEATILLRMP